MENSSFTQSLAEHTQPSDFYNNLIAIYNQQQHEEEEARVEFNQCFTDLLKELMEIARSLEEVGR